MGFGYRDQIGEPVKPHNQSAPGLGRTNDKLGATAKQYRKRIDIELGKRDKERDK